MSPHTCQLSPAEVEMSALLWTGQSGRHYHLLPDSLPGFQLNDKAVHVLVCGTEALWAGSAGDVVADPQSRARFRAAMDKDVAVYRLEPTPDEDIRVMVTWDLINGGPAEPVSLRLAG